MTRFELTLLLLFLLLSSLPTQAGTAAGSADSSRVEWRRMNPTRREAFVSDNDFRYGRPRQGLTPLERLRYALEALINHILYLASETVPGMIVALTLIFALILWVIVRLLNVDVRNLFYPSVVHGGRISHTVSVELDANDFESAIATAVSRGDFREAIRLTFLFALRKLADSGRIKLVAGKTNDEYLTELGQHPARRAAQTLRYFFDYTWYGDFQATEQVFQQVTQTFREFNERLQ